MTRLLLAALLLAACGSPAPAPTPTPTAAPSGLDACHTATAALCALNPDVRQETIATTICRSGWTATVRPPSSYTDRLKLDQIQRWDLAGPPSLWEEDHRMPLELGGAARDPMNLSPEHGIPNPKDADETAFRRHVCAGTIGLITAQVQFAAKWLDPYPGYRA